VALEAAIGGVAAIALILAVRAVRFEPALVLAMVTLPLFYAAFALIDGNAMHALTEIAVGIPFLVGGVLLFRAGDRRLLTVAGAFWIAHGVFDVVRDGWLSNDGVPGWYPAFCLGVDVAIGAYLIVQSRQPVAAAS